MLALGTFKRLQFKSGLFRLNSEQERRGAAFRTGRSNNCVGMGRGWFVNGHFNPPLLWWSCHPVAKPCQPYRSAFIHGNARMPVVLEERTFESYLRTTGETGRRSQIRNSRHHLFWHRSRSSIRLLLHTSRPSSAQNRQIAYCTKRGK